MVFKKVKLLIFVVKYDHHRKLMDKYKNKNKVLKSFRGCKIQVSHDEVYDNV